MRWLSFWIADKLTRLSCSWALSINLVFQDKQNARKTLFQYLLLAAGILLANNFVLFFYAGTLAVPVWLAKILTEITPFLISLTVQAGLIFRKDTQGKHFVR